MDLSGPGQVGNPPHSTNLLSQINPQLITEVPRRVARGTFLLSTPRPSCVCVSGPSCLILWTLLLFHRAHVFQVPEDPCVRYLILPKDVFHAGGWATWGIYTSGQQYDKQQHRLDGWLALIRIIYAQKINPLLKQSRHLLNLNNDS